MQVECQVSVVLSSTQFPNLINYLIIRYYLIYQLLAFHLDVLKVGQSDGSLLARGSALAMMAG